MNLADIWASVKPATEEESLDLAYTELHAMRRERRAAECKLIVLVEPRSAPGDLGES